MNKGVHGPGELGLILTRSSSGLKSITLQLTQSSGATDSSGSRRIGSVSGENRHRDMEDKIDEILAIADQFGAWRTIYGVLE